MKEVSNFLIPFFYTLCLHKVEIMEDIMIELFIAVKHMFERRKQSIIAMSGVAIGITVLIVALGISNGLDKNMIQNILSMTTHIKVTNGTVSIENYDELSKKIKKTDGVISAMPQYTTQGIVKYSGENGVYVSGVMIEGIRSEDAENVMKLNKKMTLGKVDFENLTGVILGKELLIQLGAKIGDKIKVISSENKDIEFTITGAFQSGFYDYDSAMIILPLRAVQIMSDSEDIVTEINVNIKDIYSADKTAGEIKKIIGPDYKTKTWGEANKNLLDALTLEKSVMVLLLSLIVVIACFVVGVILNTIVREKTRDIGIMRSMGFSSKNVMTIFLIEGTILGFIGIVLGVIMSAVLIYFLENYSMQLPLDIYYLDKLPFEISLKEIGVISGVTFGIILMSSLFPAYRAARLKPVEALKYDG